MQTKHGMHRSVEYRTWAHMLHRCSPQKTKAKEWRNYGGRGIRVCDRWQIFENFLEDVGLRPSSQHSLDRFPNNDGNYEPGNVRWATSREQNLNKRGVIWERIVLLLCDRSGINKQEIEGKIMGGASDSEIADWIAKAMLAMYEIEKERDAASR